MVAASDDPPAVWFKIGKAHHMADLVDNGHLYLNPANYFAKLDAKGSRDSPSKRRP